MAYRNFKYIYKNITLKRNVVFDHAYDQHEALKRASTPLEKMGLECVNSLYHTSGVRTFTYAPTGTTRQYRKKNPHVEVHLEIIDLHHRRGKN